jgi:hypothetical protein
LPDWVDEVVDSFGGSFRSEKRRMNLVVTLSRQNVEKNGAPFAVAVFSGSTLVAAEGEAVPSDRVRIERDDNSTKENR